MSDSCIAEPAVPRTPQNRWAMLLAIVGVFVLLLAVRWEIVDSPPFYDYALGLWREAEYLARTNFNYYSLRYECATGISEEGGPRCYLITIVPGLTAVLMRLFPGSNLSVIIFHLLSFLAAAWSIVGMFTLLRRRVSFAAAFAATAAFATTPVLATQFDMLGFEIFLIAAIVGWLRALDDRRFVAAAIWSILAFSIKTTGLLLVVILGGYLTLLALAQLVAERRIPWKTIGPLALVSAFFLAAQGAIWWSGALEQQQADRLPLTMAWVWFPDVLILGILAILGTLLLLARGPADRSAPANAPWQIVARIGDFIRRQPLLCAALIGLPILAVAISQVRFVPRYGAAAVPLIYASLPLVIFGFSRQARWGTILFAALAVVNLVNWNGVLFPNTERSLERFAGLPPTLLRREGSLLERSHEYLANHRENIEAAKMADRSAQGRPIVTALPYAVYLAIPEVGVVDRRNTVYSFYPVGPEKISGMKEVADFERDRPEDFLVLRDANAMFFAFNKVEVPRPNQQDEVLYADPRTGELTVYRPRMSDGVVDPYERWLSRGRSLPTMSWSQLWSAHHNVGASGAYVVAKELANDPNLAIDARLIVAAGAARIGQTQELIDALLETEARTGLLSDRTVSFTRADPNGPSLLQQALDALVEGDSNTARVCALQSCGVDAPFIRSLVGKYRSGLSLLDDGERRAAAPAFREILKHLPTFWPAELGLAKAQFLDGSVDTGRSMLEQLATRFPSAEEPRRLLVHALAADPTTRPRAIELARDYLERYPDAEKMSESLRLIVDGQDGTTALEP